MPSKRPVPRITIPRLRAWDACYQEEQLAAVFGKRKAFTPFEICDLRIPVIDKLWVLLRPEIIPDAQLYALTNALTLAILDADTVKAGAGDRRTRADTLMHAHREWRRGKLTDDQLEEQRSRYWYLSGDAGDVRDHCHVCDAVYNSASRCPRTAAYNLVTDLRGVADSPAAADACSLEHLKLARRLLVRLYGAPKAKQRS